ncbi:MAG: LEA type 2 family protein [Halobacteriales archaeon]
MNAKSILVKGTVVLVAVLVVSALAVGGLLATGTVTVEQPAVQSVETEWGSVTESETTIRTAVVVDNPNPVGVPGVLDVDYRASLNDVQLTSGQKRGVGLSTGRNEITLSAAIPNERISEWWVAHVNDDERSELSISGTVSGPFGISRDVSQSRTIETDILSGLTGGGSTVVSAGGERFLVMENRTARWGEATGERTPLSFSTTVTNVHDYGVTLDGMEYEVTMNGVTVGNGTTTEGVSVAPNETEQVSVTAALNSSRIADWWVTHLRNGEETNISVSVYGYVEKDGERTRVPMAVMDREMAFTSDILGDGSTSVRSLETASQDPDLSAPSVEGTDRRWGEVTDATTNVRSTLALDNPNEGTFNDLLDLRVGQTVAINDVVVADGATTYDGIESGRNELVHVAALDNGKVPEWWARHVNRGERSTVVIDPQATADLGFTKFGVDLPERRNEVTTDMLAGLESDADRELTAQGRTVAVIHSQSAEWGEATPDRAPFTVTIEVENTGREPITITGVEYAIDMNDVTVGDGTAPESYTVQPGETRQLAFTFAIDSSTMDEWWVSHVRNGEETVVVFDATATLESGTRSMEIDLTDSGNRDRFSTDLLNGTDDPDDAAAVPPISTAT